MNSAFGLVIIVSFIPLMIEAGSLRLFQWAIGEMSIVAVESILLCVGP